jgi:GNAT superfamily N-acetyltransferase
MSARQFLRRSMRRRGSADPAVRLRPLTRDDPAVDTVFAGLSPESRRLRFHTPVARLSGAVRHALLDVDGRTHAGVVAEVRTVLGSQPVGIARLIGSEPGRAELALEVMDRWQNRGMGRRLLDALGELAGELGYRELYGEVLHENQAVVRLLCRAFPGSRVSSSEDTVRVDCPMGWAGTPLTHEDILANLRSR